MRLFTGIALPDPVVGQLSRLIEHLRVHAHLRWSPAYNLHITTNFIGEWPDERLEELKAALAEVRVKEPFDLRVRGFGWFPNPHNPRVLWLGIEASESLRQLAAATDEVCAGLGIARDEKPFSAHLTLARVKEPVSLANLKRAIAELKNDDFGSWTVAAWRLYLSRPGPSGSIYTCLAEYPLTHK